MNIEKLETLALFAQAEQSKWEDAGKPWPRPNRALLEFVYAAHPLYILELITEVKRLRKDAERLDHIEKYGISIGATCFVGGFVGPKGREWTAFKYGRGFSADGETLRKAIDAAMAQESDQ